jgi:hypothetical protein
MTYILFLQQEVERGKIVCDILRNNLGLDLVDPSVDMVAVLLVEDVSVGVEELLSLGLGFASRAPPTDAWLCSPCRGSRPRQSASPAAPCWISHCKAWCRMDCLLWMASRCYVSSCPVIIFSHSHSLTYNNNNS